MRSADVDGRALSAARWDGTEARSLGHAVDRCHHSFRQAVGRQFLAPHVRPTPPQPGRYEVPDLFEPFRRYNNERLHAPGAGLDLSIVRRWPAPTEAMQRPLPVTTAASS